MSLAKIVIAGAAGGVLSIFTSWFITGMLFHKFQRLTPDTWRPEGPAQYALSSVIQVCQGAVVGLLMFVTGGLAAMATSSWLARGMVFGGVGCLVVVALVAWRLPALRAYRL